MNSLTLVGEAVGDIDHGGLLGLGDDDHTQYHTDARALTWLGTRSTTDLPEGSNLYFTDERVDDRVAALVTAGTNISVTYDDGAGTLTIATTGLTSDHGGLSGLGDDDHSHYHTDARALTWLGTRSTSDLAEGSNLYFTDERVDDRVSALIQNGTGIGWTYDDGANTLTPAVTLAPFDTGDLSEGSNLYFTDERVDDRVAALLVAGNAITLTYNDGANTHTVAVDETGIDHTNLSNIGTNTHAQIDTHIADGTTHFTEASIDHGNIAGLGDDGHTQYHTDARALTWLGTRSTSDLPEGTNLYFTDERVDDRVAALVQDGTGIAWTYVDGSNTLTGNVTLSPFDTGDLSEGSNLYFTDERVDDRVAALATAGTGISIAYDDGAGTLTFSANDSEIDHGLLADLGDDDHPQYLLTDGSRNLSGAWDVGGTNGITNVPLFVAGASSATNASLIMELISTTQGFLVPSMTTAQRDAISPNPPNGTLIFNETVASGVGRLQMRRTSGWSTLALGGADGNTNMIIGTQESGLTERGMVTVLADSSGTTRGTDSSTDMSSLVISQEGTGDCGIFWLLPGVSEWSMRIDNSDSDKLKLINELTNATIMSFDPTADDELIEVGIGVSDRLTVNGQLTVSPLSGPGSIGIGGSSGARISMETTVNSRLFDIFLDDTNDYVSFQDENTSNRLFVMEMGGPQDAMRLDSSGNLGIGIDNPTSSLHIRRTAALASLHVEAVTSGNAQLQLTANVGDWTLENNGTTGDLILSENGSGNDVMSIDVAAPGDSIFVASDGDVGFGTNTPAHQIHTYRSTGNIAIMAESGAVASAELKLKNGIPQEWSFGLGSSGLFALTDFTGLTIPFAIEAGGTPTLAWYLASTGFLGLGTNAPKSRQHVVGSFGAEVRTITASATAGDEHTIICDCTSGAITVTLPSASTVTDRIYNIKKIDSSSNAVTIDGDGAQTIDDATTQTLTSQYDFMTIQSDGTEWWILAQ